ncbi:MAG: UbiA family prenyltransferase [Chloroflexota bacterium]
MKSNDNKNIPLCVDLDGTLVATDTLHEAVLLLIKKDPFSLFRLPFWVLKGRAYFKHKVASLVIPSVENLPYRYDFVEFLREQKDEGREIYLTTASNERVAKKIADHFPLFTGFIGSNESENYYGIDKRNMLVSKFGEKGFDYCGDSYSDVAVWHSARKGILVNAPKALHSAAGAVCEIERSFSYPKSRLKLTIKQIRVYQWMKNVLIFLPMLLAHKLNAELLTNCVAAFFSFSFAASSIYVLNDLTDLNADRIHPRKRARPFASGALPLAWGALLIPILLVLSLTIAVAFLNVNFFVCLIVYLVTTTLYSFKLKRIHLLDIIILSTLYTLRLISGAVATAVALSPWLIAFSVFVFLSLAIVKRYTELTALQRENKEKPKGRDYYVEDINLLLSFGASSGLLAVLIFILYVNNPETLLLYKNPVFLYGMSPLMLYWIMRIWFMAHRGQMTDDPVVFTAKDPASWTVGVLILALAMLASV